MHNMHNMHNMYICKMYTLKKDARSANQLTS